MLITCGDNDTIVNFADGANEGAPFAPEDSDGTNPFPKDRSRIPAPESRFKLMTVGDIVQQVADLHTTVYIIGRRIRHIIDGMDGDIVLFRHDIGKLRHSFFNPAICKMKCKNMK